MTQPEREEAIKFFAEELMGHCYHDEKKPFKSALLALKAYRTENEIYQIIAFDFMDEFMEFERGEVSRKFLSKKIAQVLTKDREVGG